MVGWRPTRTCLLSAVLAIAVATASPGCGRLRHHFFGQSLTRAGSLTISPAAGPPGTPFTLAASRFRPGEAVTFQIDPPNHHRFVGPPHTAGPDGTLSATYTPLPGDPPGRYNVQAVGARGTRARGQLRISPGPPSPSTTG